MGCSAVFLSAQNSEHYACLSWKVADPEGAGSQELVDSDPHQGVDAFTLGRELGAQRLGSPLLPMEVRERHSPVIYDHLKPRDLKDGFLNRLILISSFFELTYFYSKPLESTPLVVKPIFDPVDPKDFDQKLLVAGSDTLQPFDVIPFCWLRLEAEVHPEGLRVDLD